QSGMVRPGAETVTVREVATGRELASLPGVPSRLAFAPDSTRIAGSTAAWVKAWDISTGRETVSIDRSGTVSFSPDGRYLAIASDEKGVTIWDAATGRHVSNGPALAWKPGTGLSLSLSFSPCSRYLG